MKLPEPLNLLCNLVPLKRHHTGGFNQREVALLFYTSTLHYPQLRGSIKDPIVVPGVQEVREIVKKKLTLRRTVKGWPPLPPRPPYGQLFWDFLWGVHLTLVYDFTWVETIFDPKKVFDPMFDPFKDLGWVKMSISSSNKRDNGTKKARTRSALNMHF